MAAIDALARDDLLEALSYVALREDMFALALRGTVMARLGDYARASHLLARAEDLFGATHPLDQARCTLARCEIALATRDLGWPGEALAAASALFDSAGDRANAAYARLLTAYRFQIIGELTLAERELDGIAEATLPSGHRARHALLSARIAMIRGRAREARMFLDCAAAHAAAARLPSLAAEIEDAEAVLNRPAALVVRRDGSIAVTLFAIEDLFQAGNLIVDAGRRTVQRAGAVVRLASRPVLFALATALASAWPDEAARLELIKTAFGGREADESHRARLRVEIGRLREQIAAIAAIEATSGGYRLSLAGSGRAVLLRPIVDTMNGRLLALLGDGESWSAASLALALGVGRRSVQRGLAALRADGKVQRVGRGNDVRWTTTSLGSFSATLLLPGALGGG